MSDVIGLVSVLPAPGEESYYGPGGMVQVSDETHELVDREVRRIVEACYEKARRMLGANRDRLETLAQALLERETLDEDDAYRAAGFEPGAAPAQITSGNDLGPDGSFATRAPAATPSGRTHNAPRLDDRQD